MQKFKIRGVDKESGQTTELIVSANNIRRAHLKAQQKGIEVKDISVVGRAPDARGQKLKIAPGVPKYRGLQIIAVGALVLGGIGLLYAAYSFDWKVLQQPDVASVISAILSSCLPHFVGLICLGFGVHAFRDLVRNSWRQ